MSQKTFRELFNALGIEVLGDQRPDEYRTGLGLSAWTLMQIIADPQSPAAARISAIRDAVDRIEGKALPAVEAGKSRMEEFKESFRWDRISLEDARELGRLYAIVDPDRED